MTDTHFTGRVVSTNGFASGTGSAESMTAATTLVAADNGKTFYLNTAGGFAVTLPAPTAGYYVKFVAATAPTTAYTINTASAANLIHGQICTSEDAAGSVSCVAASDIINFVANLAIIGDWCAVESDGTSWFVTGMCAVQDGMSTVQTA